MVRLPDGSSQAPVLYQREQDRVLSVGLYTARDYQPLVEFDDIRGGWSKSLILADEQVDEFARCLPAIRYSMYVRGDRDVIRFDSGDFHLLTPSRHGSPRLYLGTECIRQTQPDINYLVREFDVVKQQSRDYIIDLPDVLS